MIRRLAPGVLVLGILLVVAGVLLRTDSHRGGAPRSGGQVVAAPDRGHLPDAAPTGRSASRGGYTHRPAPRGTVPAGSRLTLPRLGVDADVVGVGLEGSVMQVPRDPATVGWWRGGAAPGAGQGSVVIVGHVNFAGVRGALGVLPDARPGDVVRLREGGTVFSYRVTGVRSYPKSRGLPAVAFTRDGAEKLVLITCGGSFDARTGNYLDNVVVFGESVA